MTGVALGMALFGSGFGTGAEAQAPPQQNPPSQAPKDENPFPGEAPQATPSPNPVQNPAQKPVPDKPEPKPTSDNPFPGEDTDVPIIPVPGAAVPPGQGSDAGTGGDRESGPMPRRDFDPDGDPVRTPDPLGNYATDDGFSSSRNGLKQLPTEDVSDAAPGKSTKNKTREQIIQEDVEVGSYYLDRKNWPAARSRFTAAFQLDRENPEAVWGLAEAERHLQLYKESADHYKLFLTYDPDGKHGREARKALAEVEAAKPALPAAAKSGSEMPIQPK